MLPRICLDNAATSFPKPPEVWDAVDRYQRQIGAAVGRGAYRESVASQRIVGRCRRTAAALLGAESPERIVFTFNGTDSLNIALHGLLRPGDHVVATQIEHNSVLRPLRELKERHGIESTLVESSREGLVDPARLRDALRPNTRLVAMTHASNVLGTVQPISDACEIAHAAGALVLVDAAQTAGHVPIDLSRLPVDLLAASGHKGLLGPLGTGILYLRPGVEEHVQSFRQGGTGSQSEDDRQPATLPDKYESGNHNAPGLAGLDAALAWIRARGIDSLRAHEIELTGRLLELLRAIPRVAIHGPQAAEERVGVASLSVEGFEPQVLAGILDENFGVQTRAGLHCAPGAHRAAGTFTTGGTVRLSLGPFTTPDDIEAAAAAVREVAAA